MLKKKLLHQKKKSRKMKRIKTSIIKMKRYKISKLFYNSAIENTKYGNIYNDKT